jgi:ubiquinone/menaquinone biosynthesis C-methylase UbiE
VQRFCVMTNPWLAIPLDDYENHMALPDVGQAQVLSQAFGTLLDEFQPEAVLLLGCAGGNGLEQAAARSIARVVGIDINPHYIDAARDRWSGRIPQLSLFVGDVETESFPFEPVDLAFAGLLLEYVDAGRVLERTRSMLQRQGVLATVVQLPRADTAEVTPSPFRSLAALSPIMRLVPPERLRRLAEERGYSHIDACAMDTSGGKQLCMQCFRREE